MTTTPTLSLRHALAEILDEDPASLSEHENLFEAGLDSIGLLRLVNRLRRDGIEVTFADLAQTPTLAAWAVLAGQAAAPAPSPAPIPANDHDGLGVMQHAYWAGRDPDQRLGGVAAHLYAEFDQAATGGAAVLDPDRLRAALEQVVARHQTLRTRITADGKQAVLPSIPLPFTVHDLRHASPEAVQSHLSAIRHAFSHQMLDIERGETFAAALSLLPDGATRLHLDVDMVAADAVSYRILLADLTRFYNAQSPAPLELTYRDTLGLLAATKAERAEQAAQAWRSRLHDLPGAPVLPEQLHAAPQAPTPQVTRHHIWLAPARKQALAERARRQGATVAMTVAALLAEVVGHWSASDHFLLNVPMFDRPASHPDIERVVGDFSSSVMLEVDLRQPQTFAQRVRALQDRMHQDAAHAAYSGLDVLRDLSRQRGETVLAPVVFTSALGLGELFPPEVTALVGRPVWVISQGPQVLLDAQVTEFDNGLLINWDTRQDALQPGLVDEMFSLFANTLDAIIDQPETWNQGLSLCPQDPLRQTADGQPVRVLDGQGRNRPDHVAGRLESNQSSRSTLWGRAEGDGRVTILGEDSQLALVNGVPVLPQQVHEAVSADPRVAEAAILPCKDGFLAAVAFAPTTEPPTGKAFRAHLARRLPAHILPAQVMVLDHLPRDGAGALDHQALAQQIATDGSPKAFVAPASALEQVIAAVWAEVLGLDQVSTNDEFIALGGDSLLAARVVARLQEDLDSPAITLRALFRAPTVADLAAHLRQEDDPARLDEVAAIIIEIGQMSDDEVAALLDQPTAQEVPA